MADTADVKPDETPATEVSSVPPVAPEPPEVPSQKPDDEQQSVRNSNALSMVWSYGMNRHVPMINMTDDYRQMIVYANAHAGVLYDLKNNKQKLLQGHRNMISTMCASDDKRWLATADKGSNSMMIVWDTHAGFPVQTVFDPHPEGITAMTMTPDAKYLATISAGEIQIVSIWDWTVSSEPVCSAELKPAYGHQFYIHFNPEDTTQIVSNSSHQVIFYSWKGGEFEFYAPPLTDQDFNKPVGRYSQSIFQSNSTQALTATSIGNLVVWDTNKPITVVDSDVPAPDKKALKLVKLQEKGVNVLTTTDQYIVTGDTAGHIKFFDQTLKLAHWYQDFNLGPVTCISFSYKEEWTNEPKGGSNYPNDSTISGKQLVVKDFALCTSTAVHAYVTTDGTDINVVHRDHDSEIHALSTHPSEPKVVLGSYSGQLQLWDYEAKTILASRFFPKNQLIRSCQFDPKGRYIAVGFVNGVVRVLDGLTLQDETKEPFRYAKDAITICKFSLDSKYLATADAEYTMTVFREGNSPDEDTWVYIGRHRAHYKRIRDVMFGEELDTGVPRLLSLAEDRVLIEYDLQNSYKDNLKILASDRIEQSAIPQCMAWYPPLTKEHFIVTANDQFKLKLYNATTKMCRRTLLGPTYGSPIQKMVMIPTENPHKDKHYVAYMTMDKVGLSILPLTGNPHNSMALIAHPTGASNLDVSYDGKFVFTAGGPDATVHQWEINTIALEAQARLGGEDLIPFYGLLDGGREGELFAELEDYFYYAQIRSQGVNTMDSRSISTKIPLTEVPFVMRAMGFYPSEEEIDDMLNEVKYSEYVVTGQYVDEIDLGDFIKLYINHRPAFGLSLEKLKWAFDILGVPTEQGSAVDRGELLDILQSKGEHMTEYELAEYLTTLLGFNEEGGSSELQEFDPSTAGDIIDQNLPQDVTADHFCNDLLGFGLPISDADILTISNKEEVE